MDDLISRRAAIDCMDKVIMFRMNPELKDRVASYLKSVPSAQPEIKPIGYRDCVNAMLRMLMDNVVTDGEYDRIVDRLHAHWGMKHD